MSKEQSERYTELIIDSIADGIFTVDTNWKISFFNRAAEEVTGITRDDALGYTCNKVLRASCCESNCPLREAMTQKKAIVSRIVSIIDARGQQRSISISAAPIIDDNGNVAGGVETFRDIGSVDIVREEIAKEYSCQDILSVNQEMRRIFETLPAIAESTSTVLIEGETGTGKELFARAIHSLSPRAAKPFIAVNCGALPDTLLESELFGYKAGAFTDAKKDKPGRFNLAEGGTIFLDEIGDISPALQVRLLRVIQEKTYEPLGSVKTVKADVRIIAATNRDLDSLVKQGKFRNDLYYRLNVISIKVPPLRWRKEDTPVLIDHFIARFNMIQGKHITGISDNALAYLMRYDFPGNIRELENIIERAFILCTTGRIERRNLPDLHVQETKEHDLNAPSITLKKMEAAFLTRILEKNSWKFPEAARELGIHKSTLYRKIKSMRIKVPSPKKPLA